MEINRLTFVGGIVGLLVIFVSIIKYFFLNFHLSSLIFGIGLGTTILIFAYIYDYLRLNDKHRNHMKNRLDELSFWAKNKGFEE